MGKTCGNCRQNSICIGCDDWKPSAAPGPGGGDALTARIDSAIKRITSGSGPMRIPADDTDPDIVLYDCKAALAALRSERDALWARVGVLELHLDDASDRDRAQLQALESSQRNATEQRARAGASERALGEAVAERDRLCKVAADTLRECGWDGGSIEEWAKTTNEMIDEAHELAKVAKEIIERNETKAVCAFCETVTDRGEPMMQHLRECPKHPMHELARDLRAAREALMLAHPERIEGTPDACAECGEPYELHDGCDPTPECDRCAHALLAKVRAAARAVVGEGKNDG
jgi:DNA-directed RNA polymerase subunit RPC12/RpoP